MLLLLAIVGCGAWWLRQYWLRLDQENSPWRAGFFSWILRGMAFPTLLWALANVGYGDRFPPLVPRLAEAQVARAPWIEQWVGVCFAGAVLIASYWTAVSYLWILGLMFRRTRHRAELAFNTAVIGLLSGAVAVGLAYVNGPLFIGAAVVIAVLPLVHLNMDLAEEPIPRPVYDRAIGQMNFGKYQAAEWELISQLEKREDDFKGWLMLAELYARQHKNIEDAARVILDLCQHPNTGPGEISLACHKLADWQLELAGNPAAARAALELLCRKLPETHFARMAQQRIRQLPRTAEELQQSRQPQRIQLPPLREEGGQEERRTRSRAQAATEANQLVERLTEDPDDIASREKLASVLALDLGKVDLAIEQLRLLTDMPETVDEQKAKWLAWVAAWELDLRQDERQHEKLLHEIIQRFPQTTQAFAAQRRLFLREQEVLTNSARSA